MSNSELTLRAKLPAAAYTTDLGLADELVQYKSFLSDEQKCPITIPNTMVNGKLYCMVWYHMSGMVNFDLQSTFPNVYIAVRLFLTLPLQTLKGKGHSPGGPKNKNELRMKMCQNRLNSLSLLAMESKFVRPLNFDELMNNFERRKSRKKLF